MTKKLPDLTDMREIAIEVFKRTGSIDELVKWARSHRTLWYQLYPKLLAQPPQTNVQVNIAVANGEDARRKLADAFHRVIAAQKLSVGDPAVFVDGERVYEDGQAPVIIEHAPQPAAHDAAHDAAAQVKPAPTELGNVVPLRVSRSANAVPGLALDGLDDGLSTTERFILWGGGREKPP